MNYSTDPVNFSSLHISEQYLKSLERNCVLVYLNVSKSYIYIIWPWICLLTEPFSLDNQSKFLLSIPRALRCSRHLFVIFDRFHFTRYNSSAHFVSSYTWCQLKFILFVNRLEIPPLETIFFRISSHKLLTSCNVTVSMLCSSTWVSLLLTRSPRFH